MMARQTSMNRSYIGTSRGQRTTVAQRTRSNVEQRKVHSFLRPLSAGIRHTRVGSDHTDINFGDAHNEHVLRPQTKNFIVGIDYGTTFTSVSYYSFENAGQKHLSRASDIKTIRNWPDAPHDGDQQVPTETWYSPIPMKREPLSEYEQFDASKSKPSSTQILEEEYDIENDYEGPRAEKGAFNFTPNEGEMDAGTFDQRQSTKFFWGYSVALQRYQENLNRDPKFLVQRPKLIMLGTAYTEGDRKDLRRQITDLIKRGIIRKYGKRSEPDVRDIRDVITDFLVKVFEHTKNELAREEGYTENSAVEFVVTVPTIWSQEASRILQKCVGDAIQATKFGALSNGSVDNLFIIPEPEAGLTWLLQITSAAVFGQTVINLDAGGGTVDCVAYEISNDLPFSLVREAVNPGGDNCGSSYLNENFKEHLLGRLRDEKYLDSNGITRKSIVDTLTALSFEKYGKKTIDIYDACGSSYFIAGLKSDKARRLTGPGAKRFGENIVFLNENDCRQIFHPVLQRVWAVLQQQLDAAFDKGKIVKNVFLLGGFAGSPSLVNALRIGLKEYAKELNLPYQIRLVEDMKKSNVAVSSGAVLRACNKKIGPQRFAQSSYGFLRQEPYQPLVFKAHSHVNPKRDNLDGERYVDVINYFMRMGTRIDSVHEFPPIKAIHTFELDKGDYLLELKCEELLYVSDNSRESHYTLTSPKNKDAQLVGSIVTNVTILRDKGHMEIITPETDGDGAVCTKPHYRVEYDILVIVEGRNLKYQARWPCSDNQEEVRKRKRARQSDFIVLETAQVSIASAFRPGTG